MTNKEKRITDYSAEDLLI